jgi:hypothetical protein
MSDRWGEFKPLSYRLTLALALRHLDCSQPTDPGINIIGSASLLIAHETHTFL